MHHFIRTSVLAAALLLSFSAAQAATQSYNFNGTLDSGTYAGQTFSGNFSFDDATLMGIDTEWLTVSNLSMTFLGNNYTHFNAAAPVEVSYFSGNFTGLAFSVETSEPKFSLIAGYDNLSQASFAYDTAAIGGSGSGNVIYAPVPEPESYAMLLAGLGLMGLVARRRSMAA